MITAESQIFKGLYFRLELKMTQLVLEILIILLLCRAVLLELIRGNHRQC